MSVTVVSVETYLEVPNVPNFVLTQTGESIPIRNLTDGQIQALGDAWVKEFIRKAQRSRDADRKPPTLGALEFCP
jgi:hypothetical protein